MTGQQRKWTVHDTLALRRITGTAVSPDGKQLVFTVNTAVMTPEKNSFLSHIHLTGGEGRPARQLTAGEHSCFAPQWSPDGRSIAYLSQNNLWLLDLASGQAQQVAGSPTAVSSFKWSPDGCRIAFTAAAEATSEEAQAEAERNGIRIVGEGLRVQRLHLVNLAELAGTPLPGTPLTGRDLHVGAPEVPGAYAWTPDGSRIVFSHSRSPSPNDMPSVRMSCLDLEDGSVRPLGPVGAMAFDPCVSPDGRWVACKVYDHPVWEWSSVVHLLPLDGGPGRLLAETHDRRPDIISFSADGKQVYFLETCGTRQRLGALPVDGGPPVVLLEREGVIENTSLNRGGTALGFTLQTTSQPVEAHLTPLPGIAPVQMSELNAEFLQVAIGRTEVIRWRSVDGLEIEGLLTHPVDHREGERHPLLVCVHGGPALAWTQFFPGMQSFYGPVGAFSARGYAILRCNVRGSTGCGKAFRRSNFRDWGGKDVWDLLSGVDQVIEMGIADPQRLGITGWSYGGFLAAAALTQTGRFRAAAIGAGMTDLVSYAMGNDSPDYLPSQFGGEVWELAPLLLECSPIVHADRITTPTLFLHGENDLRVPIWQSHELHNALKRRGVPTQMVLYPRTGHVPAEPKLLLDVMERIMAWMELHLKQ